jgi:hypothetical protein
MTSTELLAILAALLFLVTAVAITLRDGASTPQLWLLPATLSATLLGFSLVTVASEGPVALWEAHSKDLWANQIWFDLLLAIGTAWALIVPRARALGMRPLPWLALIVGTGSVGLLAMAARMLYLQNSTDRA